MQHVWQHEVTKQGVLYIRLAGHEKKGALVRCFPSPDGTYLWQYGVLVGHAKTIMEATEWVEALAENHGIPKHLRWIEPEQYLKGEYGK